MKKFSSISGSKVGEEPKRQLSDEKSENLAIKAGIISLMDRLLTIQTNGSTRRDIIQSNVRITGKEMFAEALIDFLNDKSLSDQIKALESLKSENRDWISIDEKINTLNNMIFDNYTLSNNISQIKKIKNFIESFGNSDIFTEILESHVGKVHNSEEAYLRSLTANKMAIDINYSKYSKEMLNQISDRFLKRAKELGL
jgi:hypothetical protein